MNILLLIPALNEEATISKIVASARRYLPEILVVDDGSTDDTSQVALAAGARVLRHRRNLGKGAALKTGFQYAIENGFDWVMTLDGDGQHDPADIERFLPLMPGNDLILGSRMHDSSRIPFFRRHGNRVASAVISLVCGRRIIDSQSGFRAYRVEFLKRTHLRSHRYELETEVLIKAARAGAHIAQCNIKTIYAGEVSRFRRIRDSFTLVSVVARSVLW